MLNRSTPSSLRNGLIPEWDFLARINEFLKDNHLKLKCNDIFLLYYTFWNYLKYFKGNSHGFTGLSEFLIFRFIYHQLGGSFKRLPLKRLKHRKSDRDILWKFESTGPEKVWIGQSVPVYDKYKVTSEKRTSKNRYPDIVIYENNRLKSIVQIKIYLPYGVETIKKEVSGLRSLRRTWPNLKVLLIIYCHISLGTKTIKELESISRKEKWFNFVILEKNNNLFRDVLNTILN